MANHWISEDLVSRLKAALGDIFAVEDTTIGQQPEAPIRFRGRLLVPSEQAFALISSRFRELGYTPILRRADGQDVIFAVHGVPEQSTVFSPVGALLFVLTLLSVWFVGMTWNAPPEAQDLAGIFRYPLSGLPHLITLMTILVGHELGHYFVARHFGLPVTLPYFIPLPVPPFGTMGAVIRMKSPPPNKRVMLAVGAAGPLTGILLAIPLLLIGLLRSQVQPLPTEGGYYMEGNSILYLVLKFLVFGRVLPSATEDVFIHPIAFAAWGGILVTSLNLLPAGQLDGGHIAYALFGKRARQVTWLALGLSLVLSLLWRGWLLWAALILLLGQRHAVPLDDITPLSAREKVFAAFMLLVFLLVFTPVPLVIVAESTV
ncbi:MAG: site-2 protease family protein [Chloroflexi bacterium]|nr:site-2 protease family protein [Chloroflexota bacterium]